MSSLGLTANFDKTRLAKQAERFPKAASMAINRIMKDAKAMIIRKVRSEYNVDKDLFAVKLDLIPATRTNLASRFRAVSRPLTVYRFYDHRDKQGVYVEITKGKVELLRTAYPIRFKSGKIFIVKREDGKLHIYRTISIPEMMGTINTMQEWNEFVHEKLPAELNRLIKVFKE
jgi:hypothetical protein